MLSLQFFHISEKKPLQKLTYVNVLDSPLELLLALHSMGDSNPETNVSILSVIL